uniref:cytochrome c oxidase subunit 2 n=1 Tax=Auricularia cornea TaxID=1238391 RepID=UPI00226CBA07|nr:cytochrome c oxidase subunit 2 [Auricularia cornea]UZH94031.1 cytochrome c oxidase subunit 2 [Auricularia cornea]
MFNFFFNIYTIVCANVFATLKNLNVFFNGNFSGSISNDAPYPWQLALQDPASPGFTGIFDLHDNIFFFLVVILFGVIWMLSSLFSQFKESVNKLSYKYLTHGTTIELVWTITPAIILMLIAQPSFSLLYILDEVISPTMTIKAVGHQWYWSYEYTDYETESGDVIEFDSYMLPVDDLEVGQLRLLDVDNRVNVPVDTHVRLVVQSTDVIHDFAVPSLGIKLDAVPGRLNQTSILAEREGTFYGQCSEICGVYHGFMPIAVDSLSLYEYLSWLSNMGGVALVPVIALNSTNKNNSLSGLEGGLV